MPALGLLRPFLRRTMNATNYSLLDHRALELRGVPFLDGVPDRVAVWRAAEQLECSIVEMRIWG